MILETLQAMGRWAQAKRRGGGGELVSAIGPPPAPYLHETAGSLIQDATGADDTGGECALWSCATLEGVYVEFLRGSWDISLNWGALTDLPREFIKATEIGNGVAYVGDSPFSDAWDNRV